MKKTTYMMIAMAVLVVLFVSACGGAAPQAVSPGNQEQAPVCQSSDSCSAPDVKDTIASDRYCVDKVPYQNILIDEGVTFEVLDPSTLTCVDNGTKVDGKHVIECHGKSAWKTQVKFTNTACGGANLATDSGKCQEGFGYDAANSCCSSLSGAGSTTITVNMGACAN